LKEITLIVKDPYFDLTPIEQYLEGKNRSYLPTGELLLTLVFEDIYEKTILNYLDHNCSYKILQKRSSGLLDSIGMDVFDTGI